MKTKLCKLGNSQAVILNSKILKQVGLKKDDEITLSVQDGKIVIAPVRKSFFGVLPKEDGIKLREQTKQMREEWD